PRSPAESASACASWRSCGTGGCPSPPSVARIACPTSRDARLLREKSGNYLASEPGAGRSAPPLPDRLFLEVRRLAPVRHQGFRKPVEAARADTLAQQILQARQVFVGRI